MVPINKRGENGIVSNYRLSILFDLLSKCSRQLCPHIYNHHGKYLSDKQHGFVKSRSSCTNLFAFSEAVDSNRQYDIFYTHFSKAFDRISHKILLHKLSGYPVTGTFLKYLQCYFEDRIFFCVCQCFQF